jgi:beta-glucosidase
MQKILKKSGKGGIIAVSALVVVMLAITVVSLMYYNVITQFFSKPNVNRAETDAATAAARKIIERIESEGIVLLWNENSTLPLNMSGESKVNTFGWSSISPVYSGIGSGAGNASNAVSYLDGLKNAGFSVNNELVQFYENSGISQKNKDSLGSFITDYTKHLVPGDLYSQELLNNTKNFSDVALIFLSRIGGEGSADLPVDMSRLGGKGDEHYLELSDGEKGLIDMVDRLNFKKVILVINSSFPLELSFLEEGKIDAVIWIGGPGETGMNAVGSVLSGQVNPSGRSVNTYARDLTSSPAMMTYGDRYYTGTEYMDTDWSGIEYEAHRGFIDYMEGIYVGYRYYETRYIDNETGRYDENAYRNAVQFPFGYGLSYTSFRQEIESFSTGDGRITINAKVTNTGNVAGKDVVQVYYTPPYIVGGIEKSHVVLGGFGKTGLLQPGASETVKVSFAVEDMASFDYKDKGCYVLDAGVYEIKLMSNAHVVIDSREYTVDNTIVYNKNNKRPSDKTPAVARFKDVEGDVKITYVSRADWEGTLPSNVPMTREPSKELSAQWSDFSPPEDPTAKDIVIRNNGRKLKEYIGLAYDDPQWEELLQQLSVKEMQYLIGWGGFATQAIKSIDKPYAIDIDGPSGIKALVNEMAYEGAGYTTGVVVASTWNTELVKEMGEYFGAESAAWKISGIYGPSMNIHRIPFGARNYEYFSEDSLLTGKIAGGIVTGFKPSKVYNFIKHFALYNQCINYGQLTTWSNEQAIREIYLRGFEIAVKEAGAHAVMSSYNRIGNTWPGASKALLTGVLRDEWGFEGMVISDWVLAPYMNAEQGIHAGNDLMLNTLGSTVNDTSNAGKQAMRKACHNILYTVVNSNAMEIDYYGPTPYWLYIMIAVDVLAATCAVFFFYKWNKRRKAYAQTSVMEKTKGK